VTYWHDMGVPDQDVKSAEVAATMLESFGGRLDIGDSRSVCPFSTEADPEMEADVVSTNDVLVA